MGVYGHYVVEPLAGSSGLDWFRAAASAGGDQVTVHGFPKTLASLEVLLRTFPADHDYVSVTQPLDAAGDLRGELARQVAGPRPDGLLALALVATASSGLAPWSELGLKNRKVMRETTYLEVDLLRHRASTWCKVADVPALRPEATSSFHSWWDARARRRVDEVARRLGMDRPNEMALPRDAEAGHAPILARPGMSGTDYTLFPSACTGALTLHVPSSPDEVADLGATIWGAAEAEVSVSAAGSSACILAGRERWPTPSHLYAPTSTPFASSRIAPLARYDGTLMFRTSIVIGPSGGRADAWITWRGEDWGPPNLSARGWLDDRKRARIEKTIGAALVLEDVA